MLSITIITKNYCYALLITLIIAILGGFLTCSCFTLDQEEKSIAAKNEPIVSLWDSYGIGKKPSDYLLWALWSDGFVVIRSKSGELMSTFIDSQAVKDLKRKIRQAPLLNDETEMDRWHTDGLWKVIIVKHPLGQNYITRPIVNSTNPKILAFIAKWKEFESILNSIELSNLRLYDGSRPYTLPPAPSSSTRFNMTL